jgi:hypothetical protein
MPLEITIGRGVRYRPTNTHLVPCLPTGSPVLSQHYFYFVDLRFVPRAPRRRVLLCVSLACTTACHEVECVLLQVCAPGSLAELSIREHHPWIFYLWGRHVRIRWREKRIQ